MKSKEERRDDNIRYEKPTVADLGPTAPIVGASCLDGLEVVEGVCSQVGNAAGNACEGGNGAVGDSIAGSGGSSAA